MPLLVYVDLRAHPGFKQGPPHTQSENLKHARSGNLIQATTFGAEKQKASAVLLMA